MNAITETELETLARSIGDEIRETARHTGPRCAATR